MKTVSLSEHSYEHGRNPFSVNRLKKILNYGHGWLIKDRYKDTYIRYCRGFAIVFSEFETHFKLITVYNCNPTKFYSNDRFEIIEK